MNHHKDNWLAKGIVLGVAIAVVLFVLLFR